MKISVIIPTYKRLNDLQRCLAALDMQASMPHEVIVVVKSHDFETLSFVADWSNVPTAYGRKYCTTTSQGVVQAMVQGVNAASGDVVAFTDDDSAPNRFWLDKLDQHYQSATVGGVGGRDILVNHPVVPLKNEVGKLTWYGRTIGNHHLGYGPPREVDVLKGVNMSFRRHLVEFSPFLRGNVGPENHNEVGLCLRVKHLGYTLIYDPTIIVNHYVAPRMDSEQRVQFNALSVQNSAFNMQMSLLTWLPWTRKFSRLIYSALIGDKAYPGIARFLVALARREVRVIHSFLPTQAGYLFAIAQYLGAIAKVCGKTPGVISRIRTKHTANTEDV